MGGPRAVTEPLLEVGGKVRGQGGREGTEAKVKEGRAAAPTWNKGRSRGPQAPPELERPACGPPEGQPCPDLPRDTDLRLQASRSKAVKPVLF